MKIHSKSGCFEIQQVLEISEKELRKYSQTEQIAFQHIKDWESNTSELHFQTSGSTGKPKIIAVSKEKIYYSARATIQYISPNRLLKNSLLCIPPQYIGGAMVIFRSLINNLDLTIIEPTSTPCKFIDQSYDLTSMVPLQYQKMKASDFDFFKNIIIGGAPVFETKNTNNCNVFSSFGMTETVSHFALRNIQESTFKTVGDAKIKANADGTLEIKGTITENNWLKSNDLINIQSENEFEWVGRKDFIINSGGIKINPEKIENILSNYVDGEFLISSIPDNQLHEKMVLVLTSPQTINFNEVNLTKYELPKHVILVDKIPKTASGKVNRLETKSLIKSSIILNQA